MDSKADNLTSICEPIVWKMWEPRCLTTLWAFMACYRNRFTFLRSTSKASHAGLGFAAETILPLYGLLRFSVFISQKFVFGVDLLSDFGNGFAIVAT